MLFNLPSFGFSRMLPSQNSRGIDSSPMDSKKSSAFSNIFFWFQPWKSEHMLLIKVENGALICGVQKEVSSLETALCHVLPGY